MEGAWRAMSARHIGSESGKQVTQKVPLELIDRQIPGSQSPLP